MEPTNWESFLVGLAVLATDMAIEDMATNNGTVGEKQMDFYAEKLKIAIGLIPGCIAKIMS